MKLRISSFCRPFAEWGVIEEQETDKAKISKMPEETKRALVEELPKWQGANISVCPRYQTMITPQPFATGESYVEANL